jgi:hypothetical protein
MDRRGLFDFACTHRVVYCQQPYHRGGAQP